jgi:hypothetical protein
VCGCEKMFHCISGCDDCNDSRIMIDSIGSLGTCLTFAGNYSKTAMVVYKTGAVPPRPLSS